MEGKGRGGIFYYERSSGVRGGGRWMRLYYAIRWNYAQGMGWQLVMVYDRNAFLYFNNVIIMKKQEKKTRT